MRGGFHIPPDFAEADAHIQGEEGREGIQTRQGMLYYMTYITNPPPFRHSDDAALLLLSLPRETPPIPRGSILYRFFDLEVLLGHNDDRAKQRAYLSHHPHTFPI